MWNARPRLALLPLFVLAACAGDVSEDQGPDLSAGATISERIVYYDSLGEAGALENIPILARAVGRDHIQVQMTAIEALGRIGSAEVLPALEAAGQDELPQMRVAVVLAAAEVPPPAGLPLMHRLFEDPSLRVRRAVANALARIHHPDSVEPLVDAIETTSDETILRASMLALGKIGPPAAKAIPRLVEISLAEQEMVRWAAVEALTFIGTDEAVEAIREHVASDLPEIRGRACLSLSQIEGENALELILDALAVEPDDVAAAAMARSAALLGEREASIPVLERILLRGDPWVSRVEAAMALGESGSEEQVALLRQAQHDPKGMVRKRAQEAIQSIRSRNAAS